MGWRGWNKVSGFEVEVGEGFTVNLFFLTLNPLADRSNAVSAPNNCVWLMRVNNLICNFLF